ncbi:MAG: MFS transporter [Caulobacteraceae bacterium]
MSAAVAPAAEEAAYPSPVYGWYVVALLFIAAIISYTDRQVLSLLVDPVRRDLAISDTQISLLIGFAFAMIYGVAGVPLGFLADRRSRRNLIAGAVLLWSLATISCGFVHSFGQFFVCRILIGLGEAALTPAAVSLISDYFPPQRRATALAVYFSGISVGIGGAILIGGALLHAINAGLIAGTPLAAAPPWRLVFWLIGIPGLAWAAMVFTIREPIRRHGPAPAAKATETSEPTAPNRLPLLLAPIFAAVALAAFVDNAIAAWTPSLLIRQFHRSPAETGMLLGTLFMIAGAVGILAGGAVADRMARTGGWPAKARLCLIVACIDLPFLFLVRSGHPLAVLVSVGLTYLMSGVITSAGLSTIVDLAPNRSRGLATSVSFFLNVALGAGLGPTAVALTSSRVGGEGALGGALLIVTAAGYVVIAAAMCLSLRWRARARQAWPAPVAITE